MNKFEFQLPSDHSPENVWAALNTPPSEDLRDRINPDFYVVVDELSRDRSRVDVFEPGQIIEGTMERRVEVGEDNTGLLIVEGELSAGPLERFWPFGAEDLGNTIVHYGVRKPSENMLGLVREILNDPSAPPEVA